MSFLEKYKDEFEKLDKMDKDFIDDDKIWQQLNKHENPSKEEVKRVLEKARKCIRLEPEETAILIQNQDKETIEEMFEIAQELKDEVYGAHCVFAPLYVSDECVNNCKYCGFRTSNSSIVRKTLTDEELEEEVKMIIEEGQKRVILVYGESPKRMLILCVIQLKSVWS